MQNSQNRYKHDLRESAKAYGVLAVTILFFLLVCEVLIFVIRLILG